MRNKRQTLVFESLKCCRPHKMGNVNVKNGISWEIPPCVFVSSWSQRDIKRLDFELWCGVSSLLFIQNHRMPTREKTDRVELCYHIFHAQETFFLMPVGSSCKRLCVDSLSPFRYFHLIFLNNPNQGLRM